MSPQTHTPLTTHLTIPLTISYTPSTYTPLLTTLSPSTTLQALLLQHISHILNTYNHPATCDSDSQSTKVWKLELNASVSGSHDLNVKDHDDIGVAEVMEECDILLHSPTFNFSPKAVGEVQDVLNLLHHEFNISNNPSNTQAMQMVIAKANGKGKSKAFELQTLKNLGIVTTVLKGHWQNLEDQLGGSKREGDVSGRVRKNEGPNPWDIARRTQRCASRGELAALSADEDPQDEELSRKVDGLPLQRHIFSPIFTSDQSVAFYEHIRVTQISDIARWVEVCGGLVRYGTEVAFEDLTQLVEDAQFYKDGDGGWDVRRLLGRMGMVGVLD